MKNVSSASLYACSGVSNPDPIYFFGGKLSPAFVMVEGELCPGFKIGLKL